MKNKLIVAKHATEAMLKKALRIALNDRNGDNIYFIVKENKVDNKSNLIHLHKNEMKGVVCDLLWEAAFLDQDIPLEITSINGFLNFKDTVVTYKGNTDIQIQCDENSFEKFKFSNNELLEVQELAQNEAYQILFKETAEFVKTAKKIILENKYNNQGYYCLNSVLNQYILERKCIEIFCTSDKNK